MNNNQRINQLLMQTRGLSSTNLEGTALIERLRKEAFALAAWSCREIDRITAERDEARRELCAARRELCRNEAIIRLQRNRVHRDSEDVVGLAKEIAVERGWDCFKEKTND